MDGIPWNSAEFRPIPSSSVTEFRELRRDGIGRNWVELDGIGRNSIKFRVGRGYYVSIEFPELDGIDSGAELIPVMFNIAE